MYFVQHWLNLADVAREDVLLDSTASSSAPAESSQREVQTRHRRHAIRRCTEGRIWSPSGNTACGRERQYAAAPGSCRSPLRCPADCLRWGSAARIDPYAHVATMGSRRLDEPVFSYKERRQVVVTSSHSFRSRALSGRRSPGRERQRRVSPNFVVVRVLVRVDQAAARRNAAAFALDATGSFERSLSRIAQLRTSPPTAACNSGPGTTENYVEARAATSLSRPHRSLLCKVLRLPSAHSCDMCIGVAMQISP